MIKKYNNFKRTSRYHIIRYIVGVVIFGTTLLSSCKKFVAVDAPETAITRENAFSSDATAISAMTGVYTRISNEQMWTITLPNLSTWIAGLSADEFMIWSGVTDPQQLGYYKNELSAVSNTGTEIWGDAYSYIYSCNSILEGLTKSSVLTPAVKNQIAGEAKFMRAFFYFYLVNLYGDVPLVLTTKYDDTKLLPRSPISKVYEQMIEDLKSAKDLLSSSYLDANLLMASIDRLRPNKSTASALLARIYLFEKKWALAETEAATVINNTTYQLESPENTFLKNSEETIFQLQPTLAGYNTQIARALVIPSSGFNSTSPLYISSSLYNSFESGDARRAEWTSVATVSSVSYPYVFKYKKSLNDVNIISTAQITEYFIVLRLAEQYLIRAEARAQQNNIAGAAMDLNMIRARALLPPLPSSLSQAQLLSAIMQERRVELFAEWGQRWLDLKRTNTVDVVMAVATALKGGVWSNYKQLFPIPNSELTRNPNLVQNPGY